MRDTCQIGTAGTPSGGNPAPGYTYGSSLRCLYTRKGSTEVLDGSNITPTDVEIRVPRSTTVTSKDRVKLTKLNGATLSPERFYAVVGEPWETLAQIVLHCKLLPGETVSAK